MMRERPGWVKGMLTGIPNSTPNNTQPPPNVVQLQNYGFDEIARSYQDALNNLVKWEAEAARVELGYNEALHQILKLQKKWTDRSRDVMGSKNEFPERGGPIHGDVDGRQSAPEPDDS